MKNVTDNAVQTYTCTTTIDNLSDYEANFISGTVAVQSSSKVLYHLYDLVSSLDVYYDENGSISGTATGVSSVEVSESEHKFYNDGSLVADLNLSEGSFSGGSSDGCLTNWYWYYGTNLLGHCNNYASAASSSSGADYYQPEECTHAILSGNNYVTISSNGVNVAQVVLPTEEYGECEVLWTSIEGLTCEGQIISSSKYAISTYINGNWQQNKHSNWETPSVDSGKMSLEGSGEGGSCYYNFRYSIQTSL